MNLPDREGPSSVLLQELNHRFFNSLQIIDSLISGLSRDEQDGPSRRIQSDACRERVRALANLHRRLAMCGEAEEPLEEEIAEICEDLLRAHGAERVAVTLNIAPLRLSPARRSRLTQLLVELVTNALKHGLRQGGLLQVMLLRSIDGGGELIVSNQALMPVITGSVAKPRIAVILSDSLQGNLRIYAAPSGRCVRVSFPLHDNTPDVRGSFIQG